jgi:bla regulator protein BlaR1
MVGELTNHLWQSTLFAVAAGLLTLAFRKNRAPVSYWLWFSASLKFFVPFGLLIGLGGRLWQMPAGQSVAAPAVSFAVEEITQPFARALSATPAGPSVDWLAWFLLGGWVCGFGVIAFIRLRDWLRIRAAVRSSLPLQISASVEARSCSGLLEPGVVGFFRPILLLPVGILERLTSAQLEAVLAHELCHVRRRDNLTSGIHMLVEAVFWFHPLVWWIGARLVEERELACDEGVLRLGSEPQVYAAAIVSVCRLCVESPLACVAGVTGADLMRRIEAILSQRIGQRLNRAKKVLLAGAGAAALALPVVSGVLIHAEDAAGPKFEVASIKPCTVEPPPARGSKKGGGYSSSDRVHLICQTVTTLMQAAYGNYATAHFRPLGSEEILGGPAWMHSTRYVINAKAEAPQTQGAMHGPMLRRLLEDRFKLRVHRETKMVPVYALKANKGSAKLEPSQEGSCIAVDWDHPPSPPKPGQAFPKLCGMARLINTGFYDDGATIAELCQYFSGLLDRPVIDKTGITGKFDIHLDLSAADLGHPSPDTVLDPSDTYAAVNGAMHKLGLKMEATKGPKEFLVVDSVERPSEN